MPGSLASVGMENDGAPGALMNVLADVAAERDAQDQMWGVQEFPDGSVEAQDDAVRRSRDWIHFTADRRRLDEFRPKTAGPGFGECFEELLGQNMPPGQLSTRPGRAAFFLGRLGAIGELWSGETSSARGLGRPG